MIQTKAFDQGVNSHEECRLGKWYYGGQGRDKFASHQAFRSIEQPHKEVHESGKFALNFAASGHPKEMIKALDSMENASLKVVGALDLIIR
jgi:hypothetical protein